LVFFLFFIFFSEDNRILSKPFMRLPTQKELPEYYDMIKHPVDFNKIKKKLGEYRYRNLDELEADVMLLCKNAQEFNMENSNVIFQMNKSHQYFSF